jgi:hypothetical protein
MSDTPSQGIPQELLTKLLDLLQILRETWSLINSPSNQANTHT